MGFNVGYMNYKLVIWINIYGYMDYKPRISGAPCTVMYSESGRSIPCRSWNLDDLGPIFCRRYKWMRTRGTTMTWETAQYGHGPVWLCFNGWVEGKVTVETC